MKAYLTPDQYSLYRLIWNRFVASQMNPATFDETTVEVTAGDYLFRVKGTVPKFAGWMATYGLTPGESEQPSPTTNGDGAATAGEDEDDLILAQAPRDLVPAPRLESAVGHGGEAQGPVEMGGLGCVADVELDVVEPQDRERVGAAGQAGAERLEVLIHG